MYDSSAGHIMQTVARTTQSPRQINIFAVHEDSRLKAADFAHCRRAQQHCCPAHPFGIKAHRVVSFGMLKRNLPHLPRDNFGVVICGIFPQLRQRACLGNRILIEGKNISRLRVLQHAIDARAEAKIALATPDGQRQSALLHVAVKFAHVARRRRITIVVPHAHGQRHPLSTREQYRFQQCL